MRHHDSDATISATQTRDTADRTVWIERIRLSWMTLAIDITHRKLPSMVFIGAEGGWIDYEIDLLAEQGCTAVNIGPRILRTEAAVNVILGQWLL